MRGDGVELEANIDAVLAGAIGQPVGVLELKVPGRALDEQRRQAGQVGGQRAHERIVDRVAGEVGVGEAPCHVEHRERLGLIVGVFLERAPGEVDPGTEQHRAPRQRDALLLEAEQEGDGQPTARRVAHHGDVLRFDPAVDDPAVGAHGVLECRRKRMLGRQAVLGNQRGGLGRRRQGAGDRPVPERRSERVPAAVQVQQRDRRLGLRAEDEGGHAAGVDRARRDFRWQ